MVRQEVFQPKFDQSEEPEKEKRSTVTLPFPQKADRNEVPPNPMWSKHARFMAETAGITLSPETIVIYERLREEKPDPKKENHGGMSDQKLLAEALRMSGDMHSLAVFTEKNPHIFNPKL